MVVFPCQGYAKRACMKSDMYVRSRSTSSDLSRSRTAPPSNFIPESPPPLSGPNPGCGKSNRPRQPSGGKSSASNRPARCAAERDEGRRSFPGTETRRALAARHGRGVAEAFGDCAEATSAPPTTKSRLRGAFSATVRAGVRAQQDALPPARYPRHVHGHRHRALRPTPSWSRARSTRFFRRVLRIAARFLRRPRVSRSTRARRKRRYASWRIPKPI